MPNTISTADTYREFERRIHDATVKALQRFGCDDPDHRVLLSNLLYKVAKATAFHPEWFVADTTAERLDSHV